MWSLQRSYEIVLYTYNRQQWKETWVNRKSLWSFGSECEHIFLTPYRIFKNFYHHFLWRLELSGASLLLPSSVFSGDKMNSVYSKKLNSRFSLRMLPSYTIWRSFVTRISINHLLLSPHLRGWSLHVFMSFLVHRTSSNIHFLARYPCKPLVLPVNRGDVELWLYGRKGFSLSISSYSLADDVD